MKASPLILGVLASVVLPLAVHSATLTQKEIIELLQLKTPEAEIIQQIESGGTKFTLGAEDIARLRRAGATPAILAALQGGGGGSVSATDLNTAEISDLCLVVDYSGSMNETTADGVTKMTAAKQAVVKLIDALPPDLNVAVVVYGTNKDRGCEDIDLIHPLGKLNKDAIKKRLLSLPNTGFTPIASSLNIAGLALKKATAGRAIVLVTDGVESCKGEPAKVAAKLASEFGVKFGLHVVGFDIKPQERASLAAIAQAGNGQYLNAKSAVEFASAMQKITAVVAEAAKPEPVVELPATTGGMAPMMVFVDKGYSWENPLHTELVVNGRTVDNFSANTRKDMTPHLKDGWNTITMITRVKEPVTKSNSLVFRIGPVRKDVKASRLVMAPVLWEFHNHTDWDYENGKYTHPLGPDTKEVKVTHELFYKGMKEEEREIKAGDFVLQGRPNYKGWNSPVSATVHVNGTPLNSFTLEERQIVVTPFLKEGKNEVRIISDRVQNAYADNDILFSLIGPVEWVAAKKKFEGKPIVAFEAKPGWEKDDQQGFVNKGKPGTNRIERVIAFFVDDVPGGGLASTGKAAGSEVEGTPPEGAGKPVTAPLAVLVKRNYGWENPLHSEFAVNGKTVDIFSSETRKDIAKPFREGWNEITIITRPQDPASQGNDLMFKIGPMQKDPRTSEWIMNPVLWEFRNGTDWEFENGRHTHPLGPDTKEVTLTVPVFFAGMQHENATVKAGDYLLQAKANYGGWNTPITAMVYVNGTPLNSVLLQQRQMVVTPLIKKGPNEIKLVSRRIKNVFAGNDILFSLGGPAAWVPAKKNFEVKQIVKFEAMEGWEKDDRTGQLKNTANPEADTLERVISFNVE
jgi:Mg-chelatase subunit ChlD